MLSRHYVRWTSADPERPGRVAELAGLSLAQADLPQLFSHLLQIELDAGYPLPRAMRRLRNLLLCALIARDLDAPAPTGNNPGPNLAASPAAKLAEVMRVISAFADFAITTHLNALSEELHALHGIPTGAESGQRQDLIVLGMGKLGGAELNVSSDIDLIFIYPEDGETRTDTEQQRPLSNHEFFTRLGKRLISDLCAITEDGFTFRVDMALRPNGSSGPLVASLAMLEDYLIVQGREWERYAWVKARAISGSPAGIAALEAIVRPFVYRRYLDFGAIDAMRKMHAQIRAEVKRQEIRHPHRNNIKLGRGGIREIEFLAQVFQLIRGGRDAELRSRSTRATLRTLAEKRLLDFKEVETLQHAYVFLRNLEHRLQYLDDAQTHALPASPDDLSAIARMMGYDSAAPLLAELEAQHALVAARFDAIFSDRRGAAEDGDGAAQAFALHADDSAEVIEQRLQGLGFDDPAGAAQRLAACWGSQRIRALPQTSRAQLEALFNVALPLVARCAGHHATTLARLLDFFEAIARRAAYLALLTEYPAALARVIRMMSASGWAAKYLTQHPLLLDELLDDATLQAAPDWHAFEAECQRQLDSVAGDTERQMDMLRELHHAQLLRLLAQDLEGQLTVERLADHLSALADVLVGATLRAAWHSIPGRHREQPRFAVIAYGKLGGKELGYASDLDVIFLYDDPDPEAPALYAKLAQRFITWMTSHTPAGILFDIDIALRPDGASGLMVSSIAGFEKYQMESAWLWEHQALTRARFCAGDAAIGARFEALRETVLRQPRDPEWVRKEVLAMRARMHSAHPNRTQLFDVKHDAGGMIDIEFIVQTLVLTHAAAHPQLTADIGNIALLKLAGELGLADPVLASQVADAYRSLRRLQHQIRLQGDERARVDPAMVEEEARRVGQLYRQILGSGAPD